MIRKSSGENVVQLIQGEKGMGMERKDVVILKVVGKERIESY